VSPPATDRVRGEWANRVRAEYTSAAITQHLTLWLIQMGASPDLVRDGLRIVDDEMDHAELSHAVLEAAGGALDGPIPRESLGLRRNPGRPLEWDVLWTGVRVFCLGETVAVPLFSALRGPCTQSQARDALDRILVDEVRHRDFGWTLLAWMLEQHAGAQDQVQSWLPGMFAEQRAQYAAPGPEDPVSDSERAWGLMPPSEYAAVLARTVERDYVPRFGALGVNARQAWDA
jgi:hypothetical protein